MAFQQMMITFGVCYAYCMEIWFKSYSWYDPDRDIMIKPVSFPHNLLYALGVFGIPLLHCVFIVLLFKFCY